MVPELPSVEGITTVAGVAIAVVLAFQFIIKPIANWSADTYHRFGPLVAIVLGVVIMFVSTFFLIGIADAREGFITAYNGVSAGLMAIGLFKTYENTVANN